MTSKREIQEGVILGASLTKVVDGYAMTSILNANDEEVDIHEPLVELDEIDPGWDRGYETEIASQDREREIISQLRLENMNGEERKMLEQTCLDYQDIFYLLGDKLSSTGAARHSNVEPGTEPINTRPYRLPDAQKMEVGKQVKKLLREGIIEPC